MAKHPQIHQMTIAQFEVQFPHDDACKEYLKAHRWPEGVRCPRCDHDKVYALESRPHHWQCHNCAPHGYRFSVLVGTIFENTNYPLRAWFRVIHMMLTSKKGVSALQVHRTIGTGSYRTAWYMCHRIRVGLGSCEFQKLIGFVEVDETYIGGKGKNKHKDQRGGGPRGPSGKTPIVGAVSHKGNAVARVIEHADSKTIKQFIDQTISHRVSLLSADDNAAYRKLDSYFRHGVVRHSEGEYVVGAIHTNTIEGFWSMIKRGIVGTFHKVSKKYLPLYVSEFKFRYNNRKNKDIFGVAVAIL